MSALRVRAAIDERRSLEGLFREDGWCHLVRSWERAPLGFFWGEYDPGFLAGERTEFEREFTLLEGFFNGVNPRLAAGDAVDPRGLKFAAPRLRLRPGERSRLGVLLGEVLADAVRTIGSGGVPPEVEGARVELLARFRGLGPAMRPRDWRLQFLMSYAGPRAAVETVLSDFSLRGASGVWSGTALKAVPYRTSLTLRIGTRHEIVEARRTLAPRKPAARPQAA